jgi:hypothetical protein
MAHEERLFDTGLRCGRPLFANGREGLRSGVKDDGPRGYLCTLLGSFTHCGSVESVKAEADDGMKVKRLGNPLDTFSDALLRVL